MNNQRIGQILFWTGFLVAVAFAGVIGQGLYSNLRTLTGEELEATIWALDKPIFLLWALSITIGSILAGIGAFVYVKTKAVFSWVTGVGVIGAVVATVIVWSRVYNSTLFGVGGIIILLAFFAIVWTWMKRYAGLDIQEKIAGSYKLIGYLFWINASWFLCGDTAKLHLKVFEGSPAPTPFEIMVLLVLGWVFVMLGDYKELRLKKS
jgi:hypothetical protein